MDAHDLSLIKAAVEEFLLKMTISDCAVAVSQGPVIPQLNQPEGIESIAIAIQTQESKFLIGQGGVTLFDLQRILRIFLNRRLQKGFFVRLDINDYQKQKEDYLREMARLAADQVVSTGVQKALSPMPNYERRIIHEALSQRTDIATQSQGAGEERSVVITKK